MADTTTNIEHKVTFCRICEPLCGMVATVEDGRLVALRPDRDHPLSTGFACQKGIAFTEVVNDADRVTMPLRRTPAGFEQVGWNEALTDIAERLSRIVGEHGPGAVGWYMGNPGAFSYAHVMSILAFIKGLGRGTHFYTASSQDTNSRLMASQLLYGTPISVPIPDLNRTGLLVVIGANPVVSHGSFLTAPRIKDRMNDVVKRGGRVVVVDPRRTETAAAFEWCGIVPDTDAYLLLSLLQVMFDENLVDARRIGAQADGLGWLRALVASFAPETTQRHTGIDPDVVRALARDLAATPRAAIYGRLGTCVGRHGTLTSYLIDVVNLVAGNLDVPGRLGVRQPRTARPAAAQPRDGRRAAPHLPAQAFAHRRFPLGDRFRTGGADGQGDAHPGAAPDPGDVHQRRQPGVVGAQRPRVGISTGVGRVVGGAGFLPHRDHRALRLRPAGHHDVRTRRFPADLPDVPGHAVPSGHRGRRRPARAGAPGVADRRRPDRAPDRTVDGVRDVRHGQPVAAPGRHRVHASQVRRRHHPGLRGRRPFRIATQRADVRPAHR